MHPNILLDGKNFDFKPSALPLLIHAESGTGASKFSLTLLSDLFLRGIKILSFTARDMATMEFLTQIDEQKATEVAIIESPEDGTKHQSMPGLIVKSGDVELFFHAITRLSDLHERVLFIKNIESMPEAVFDIVEPLPNIILAGNIDLCPFKDRIIDKSWNSVIFFSPLSALPDITLPALEKYQGYLLNDLTPGIVTLDL